MILQELIGSHYYHLLLAFDVRGEQVGVFWSDVGEISRFNTIYRCVSLACDLGRANLTRFSFIFDDKSGHVIVILQLAR